MFASIVNIRESPGWAHSVETYTVTWLGATCFADFQIYFTCMRLICMICIISRFLKHCFATYSSTIIMHLFIFFSFLGFPDYRNIFATIYYFYVNGMRGMDRMYPWNLFCSNLHYRYRHHSHYHHHWHYRHCARIQKGSWHMMNGHWKTPSMT